MGKTFYIFSAWQNDRVIVIQLLQPIKDTFKILIIFNIKDNVKSVLHMLSAHNKNNCRDPTVGILIKLKLLTQ